MPAPVVSPFGFIVGLASSFSTRAVIFGDSLCASLTLYSAAPVEFTVAAADHLDALLHHSQAALVAQSAAAPSFPPRHVLVSLDALAALGALQAQAQVLGAVVRRVLQINQFCAADAAEGVVEGAPVVRAVTRSHAPLVHL